MNIAGLMALAAPAARNIGSVSHGSGAAGMGTAGMGAAGEAAGFGSVLRGLLGSGSGNGAAAPAPQVTLSGSGTLATDGTMTGDARLAVLSDGAGAGGAAADGALVAEMTATGSLAELADALLQQLLAAVKAGAGQENSAPATGTEPDAGALAGAQELLAALATLVGGHSPQFAELSRVVSAGDAEGAHNALQSLMAKAPAWQKDAGQMQRFAAQLVATGQASEQTAQALPLVAQAAAEAPGPQKHANVLEVAASRYGDATPAVQADAEGAAKAAAPVPAAPVLATPLAAEGAKQAVDAAPVQAAAGQTPQTPSAPAAAQRGTEQAARQTIAGVQATATATAEAVAASVAATAGNAGTSSSGTNNAGINSAAASTAAASNTSGAAQAAAATAGAQTATPAAPAAPPQATAPPQAAYTTSASANGDPSLPMPGQVMAKMRAMRDLGDGTHLMQLRVNPDHLGPVRIVATISGDSIAMELHAATAAGRDALRAGLGDMRRDFIAPGLNTSVDLGSDADGRDQNARDQNARDRAAFAGDGSAFGDRGGSRAWHGDTRDEQAAKLSEALGEPGGGAPRADSLPGLGTQGARAVRLDVTT